MERTRVWRLLQGYRGKPPAAIDAIAEVLIRLGQLAADHPEIRELDINPLLADAGRRRSRSMPASASRRRRGRAPRAWRSHPTRESSQAVERLRDGTAVDLRPIRPEDEPLLHDLAAHMTPGGFAAALFRADPRPVASARGAADADRLRPRDGARRAAARRPCSASRASSPIPTGERAEYAVAVRSDWKGRGVGYVLMQRLIEIARQCGIGELVGEVLARERADAGDVPRARLCNEAGSR